jgi:hypothetical protein
MNASAQVVATATAGEQNASHVMAMAAQTQRLQNRITADRAGAMEKDPSLAEKEQKQAGTKALSALMADAKLAENFKPEDQIRAAKFGANMQMTKSLTEADTKGDKDGNLNAGIADSMMQNATKEANQSVTQAKTNKELARRKGYVRMY